MRKLRKLAALAMAAVMCMGLATSAFAAEGEGPTPSYTYDVFQIFTGQYADSSSDGVGAGDMTGKTLSNVKWGVNGTGETGTDVPDTVLDKLAALVDQETGEGQEAQHDASNKAKLAVILEYVNLESEAVATGKKLDEVNAMDLSNGYYLVRVNSASVEDGEAFDIYTVQVVDNKLNLSPKYEGPAGNVPTVEKEIVVNGDTASKDSAAIGDTVTFMVKSTLPTNMHDYKEYYWVLTDTMSAGLTWEGNVISATINGTDVGADLYVAAAKNSDNEIVMGFNNILDVMASKGIENADSAEVVIVYTAVVNKNAEIASANSNDVVLTYSSDPNTSGDGTLKNNPENPPTPGDKPVKNTVEGEHTHTESWITGLTVEHFNTKGAPLTGSTFELTGENLHIVLKYTSVFTPAEDGNYYKLVKGGYTNVAPKADTEDQYDLEAGMFTKSDVLVTEGDDAAQYVAVIDENGQLTITGLKAGTYTLKNTEIPNGYSLAEDIKFTISFDETNLFTSDNEDVQERTPEWFYVTLYAPNGVLLPETGGAGLYALYVGGAIAVIAACGILFVKNKKKNDDAVAE